MSADYDMQRAAHALRFAVVSPDGTSVMGGYATRHDRLVGQIDGRSVTIRCELGERSESEVTIDVSLKRPLLLGAWIEFASARIDPELLVRVPKPTITDGIEPERVDALVYETPAGRSLTAEARELDALVTLRDSLLRFTCSGLPESPQGLYDLLASAARLAGLAEQARSELPWVGWETTLWRDLQRAATDYGLAAAWESMSLTGSFSGTNLDARLTAARSYGLLVRVQLSRPTGFQFRIQRRKSGFAGFLGRVAAHLPGSSPIDRMFHVEPGSAAIRERLDGQVTTSLGSLSDSVDVDIDDKRILFHAHGLPLDPRGLLERALEVERGLVERAESPYR